MTDLLAFPASTLGAAALRPGLLVAPADDGWDAARQAWNLAVDQRPAAVALPESPEDVVAVVAAARRAGLRVAAQGTGHNATPLGDLSDTVLVKTHRMRGVEIDPVRRVARVQAGALWMDVVLPAAEHGLAPLAGSAPDVGVVGYSLGGGVGWLSRRYGTAASRIIAVDVVTADGEIVRADRVHHSDLFWALRGGGGAFGVVTAMELELVEPGPIHAGICFFDIARGADVLHAWREWAPSLPDTVATIARFLRVPPLPDIPEALRGRAFVVVEAVVLGPADDADALLAPIRALGPEMDTFADVGPQDLIHLHMDPPNPIPAVGDHALLDDLTAETVDALVAAAGADSGGSLVTAQLMLGGGAIARSAGGAMDAIEARFLAFAAGVAATPEIAAASRADLDRFRAALASGSSAREYLNYAERAGDPARLFEPEAYARLRQVKAAVDPSGTFRSNHDIRPA